jgi:hypothetical protein
LKAILGKIRPEPAREPLPPPKVYAPGACAPAVSRSAQFFVAGLRRTYVIFGPNHFDAEISGWADVGTLVTPGTARKGVRDALLHHTSIQNG